MVTPTGIEPLTPTPTLPHQGGGNQRAIPHRGRHPKAPATEAPADSQQTLAELQRQLDECRTELAARDSDLQESLEYQTATPFTHPPPRWGRDGVGVIALIGVGVTDRRVVGVMPRTDPW